MIVVAILLIVMMLLLIDVLDGWCFTWNIGKEGNMIEKIRFIIRSLKIKLYKLKWCISSKKDEKRYKEKELSDWIENEYGRDEEW